MGLFLINEIHSFPWTSIEQVQSSRKMLYPRLVLPRDLQENSGDILCVWPLIYPSTWAWSP
jgi:hypothetical protein